MLVLFVYLAFLTGFDIFPDAILHTFPVHRSTECLLETGCSRVFEVVMVPTYCSMSKGSRNDHGCTFAQYLCVFDQLSGVFGITSQFLDIGGQLPESLQSPWL